MKIKQFLILSVFLILSHFSSGAEGEEYTIKGKITDERGAPLAGAGIVVINKFIGTYSANDGSYLLKVKAPGIIKLRFSYTGYEPVIKEVSVSQTLIIDVSMIPAVTTTEDVIVSATRAGSRTPVAYSGVSGEEIRKNNFGQDMPFLIGMTPSLIETSEAGTGLGYTSFRIRGTDGSRINVTIDGIPLNDAESQQVFWVDLPDLASSVDNIQVQRGVGTSSNGSGAFGASVNLQTKSPGNSPFVEINSTLGSFNTMKKMITAGTGLISDRFALQLRYSDLQSDGYIKRTGIKNRSMLVSGVFRNEKSFLKANVIMGEEHTGISWWGVPAEMLKADRRYNPAGEYTDELGNKKYYNNESDNYLQNHYQLIYSLNLNSHLNFHAAVHYTSGEGYYEEYREDQSYSDYRLPALKIDTSFIYASDLIRRKWMRNGFLGTVYSINYKRERIEAVLGGGINNYNGNHFGRLIWMRNAGNTEKDYQWYLNKAKKGEFSIYGKISYGISKKLTGFGDLQYRHISYRMAGPDDDLKDITQSHYFNFLNPKAGLYLSVSSQQEAYLSFSIANKEPTRSDFKDASGDNKVTPRAETLYDAETGYKIKTGRADFGINLYGMFYKDQLIPTGQLSNVGYPIMTNVRSSYRTGIELTMNLRPAARLEWNLSTTLSTNKILHFIEYYTDYNALDWSYISKNLGKVDIAYSPALTGWSDLAWSFSGNLKIHVISKYVGRQYFDNTMSRSRLIDPYFVNNLRLDYSGSLKRTKGFEIKLLINNLLNSFYESNAYGGFWYEDGVEKNWAYFFPQAGINFMLNLGLNF